MIKKKNKINNLININLINNNLINNNLINNNLILFINKII